MTITRGTVAVLMAISLPIQGVWAGSNYTPPPPVRYTTPNYTTPNHPAVPATAVPPDHLGVGNQYYDATISGLGEYMDALQTSNPKAFRELEPEYSSMKSRNTTGNIVLWGSLIGGSVLSIGGVSFLATKQTDAKTGISTTKMNSGALFGGLGLMAVGTIVGIVIKPGRSDFLKFLNHHNRINSGAPMELRMGATFEPGKLIAGLSLSF